MACKCGTPARPDVLTSSTVGVALLGGLLSSSCCVLQLFLNTVNLGCAGFAVLTPHQGKLRALTFTALALLLLRQPHRRSLLTAALALALMFSQDAVRAYNQGGPLLPRPPWGSRHSLQAGPAGAARPSPAAGPLDPAKAGAAPATAQSTASLAPSCPADTSEPGDGLAAAAPPGPPDEGPPPGRQLYLHLRVEGIKCEGCAARLKQALLRAPGVARCVVDFGSARVLLWGGLGVLSAEGASAAIQFADLSYRPTLVESREL